MCGNLGRRFAAIVSRFSGCPALRYDDGREILYKELCQLSFSFATKLELVVGDPERPIVIFHDKSPEAYASMLGCLLSGRFYVCLDPESPLERLSRILDTCDPSAIFDFCGSQVEISDRQVVAMTADTVRLDWFIRAKEFELSDADLGEKPAYAMFTSGSTGWPKGAMISQRNVEFFIDWILDTFDFGPGDVLTNVNPMFFDNSVFDFFGAFFSGACLAPFSAGVVSNPRKLVQAVEGSSCTHWFSTPSLLNYLLTMRALDRSAWPKMKTIMFGGEGFPKSRLKKLYELVGDRVSLANVYGPTECTCICTSYTISERDFEQMELLAPLGKLIRGFDGIILDYPEGGQGELVLFGPAVGMGYLNDPEQTQSRFCETQGSQPHHRLGYHTGDLVATDRSGNLHFKGRIDLQIKHLGYRIEIEEIEAAFQSIPYLDEVAITYRQLGEGLGEICAHVVCDSHYQSSRTLLNEVSERLPNYMLPKKVIFHEALPKTSNGKVDRKALAEL
jgi:D-alanine--poly(phosphoribitol) ligase subunit 1